MRLFFLLGAFLLALNGVVHGAEDPVAVGMKLYEKRHYEEALIVLLQGKPAAKATGGSVNLALGMTYLQNAGLHRELHQISRVVYHDYLKRLTSEAGGSQIDDLFLAEVLLDSGKPAEAAVLLERVLAAAKLPVTYLTIAKAELGLCAHFQNNPNKAKQLLEGISSSDPEVMAALASILSRTGMVNRDPLSMADKAVTTAKTNRRALPMRMVKDVLTVYGVFNQTDKGLDFIRSVDLKSFSYEEKLGKDKIIYFYDVALLDGLTRLYGQAAIASLTKAATDPKLKEIAEYYLGAAHFQFGSLEQASRFTTASMAAAKLPQLYRNRAAVLAAAISYQQGKKVEAIKAWEELIQKQPESADLLAETVEACAVLRAESPSIVQRATTSAERGEGKKFFAVNAALGKYYLDRKDYAKAATFMEAGRDKGNKNKIEANDPELLVNLAEAYYQTKKYSEAQEIFFEMGKQFPQVRQIQDALQGIYSREQKSAGDVRIF